MDYIWWWLSPVWQLNMAWDKDFDTPNSQELWIKFGQGKAPCHSERWAWILTEKLGPVDCKTEEGQLYRR